MGMYANLQHASCDEVARLFDAPEQLNVFLFGEEAAEPPSSGGLLSRLFGGSKRAPAPPPIQRAPRRAGDEVDLDKAWHGVHFLLTGTAWEGEEPACYLVKGGRDIDDDGYARALTADEVRRFADFLQTLTPEELERRYDPGRMMALEIYPEVWDREPDGEESELGWLLDAFADLRDFAARARDVGECVIVHVS